MNRLVATAFPLLLSSLSSAQFAWPGPQDHDHSPDVYREDPFIVEYRQKFFAVFRGDFATFEKAYKEIQGMVERNPRDARAIVWLGNGETIKATAAMMKSQAAEAKAMLDSSRKHLDAAVALRPNDPNIYMMRAATLYIQGQYLPADWMPKRVWETLRDDCKRFIAYIGPDRLPKVSPHVRGETFGELGIAYLRLGDKEAARKTFELLLKQNPSPNYAARAKRELAKITAR